jgi:hypothetical protein
MSLMGEDRSETSRLRVTVAEAAEILGITVEAVRGRIKRDTLAYEKAPDGTVWVLLDADQARPVDDQPVDRATDQALLIARLENEVQFLREELARKDAIMMNMTEAMKAIAPPGQEEEPAPPSEAKAPPDRREYAVTPTEQPGRVGPQPAVESAEEGVQRPWWRRWFGE